MTVETRHDIGDHEIGLEPVIGTLGKRLFAAAGRNDMVAATLEHAAGGGSHTCLVIDQQNRRLTTGSG